MADAQRRLCNHEHPVSPSESKSEAVETAAFPLRERQRAESGQLAAAEKALRRADREHDRASRKARGRRLIRGSAHSEDGEARQTPGETEPAGRHRAIAETRSLLGELSILLEEGEDALDMAAAIHAGHDGVLVVTDRRLIFVAPRRKLSRRHDDIASIEVRGRRWLGTRITVSSRDRRTTFSAIRRRHANELAELLRERTAVAAG